MDLFSESCPSCGRASPAGFCSFCIARFRRLGRACRICALPLPVTLCPRMSSWQLDFLIAPFAYAPPLDEFVLALKYRGARRYGGLMRMQE